MEILSVQLITKIILNFQGDLVGLILVLLKYSHPAR
jgi:hypothetical protein